MIRAVTAIGLAIVASCAVAVSFAGLYGLALLCSFGSTLAALVPVLVDAGAGVATVVWLAGDVPQTARRYAQKLALGLLAVSVAGNAGSHALVAAGARPHWVVVVMVGALAPAVLAAVIHLSALVKAGGEQVAATGRSVEPPAPAVDDEVPADEPEWMEAAVPGDELAPAGEEVAGDGVDPMEKARKLAAAGAGRPRLVALGLSHHQAKQVLRQVRQESPA